MHYFHPKVSIVTPSYNQASYIEEAILSVIEQDYKNIEHIVVDGGSSDGTINILKKYNEKIIWISEKDEGQGEALNKGFKLSKGEIIGWLNADDLYKPHAVKRAVEAFREYPDVYLVHGNGQYIDDSGNVLMNRYGGDFGIEKLIGIDTIMSIATFFRRGVFEMVGFIDETLHFVLDWEYWVRIGMAGLKMKHINGPALAQSREHANAKTVKEKELFWKERFQVFERMFSSPALPKEIKRLEKRAYSGVYASSAFFYLRYGRIQEALSALIHAIQMWPGILVMYNPLFIGKNLLELVKANIALRQKN